MLSPLLFDIEDLYEYGVLVDDPLNGRDEEPGIAAKLFRAVDGRTGVVLGLVPKQPDSGIAYW